MIGEAIEYARVVRELCMHLDAEPQWPEVVRSQHLQLDETPVGLIHDEARTGDTVCVFLDLGAPVEGPLAAARLLTANATIGRAERGYFAIHPEHERLIYCANVALTRELTGEVLAATIQALMQDARAVLQQATNS